MKKKGFTLVELLVVIAIIALLMGILMPALAKVRQLAYRVICGTNLRGIGTSMQTYANDDSADKYPRAGELGQVWGEPTAAGYVDGFDTDGLNPTISASFFLLVRGAYTGPEQFLCKSDGGATEFQLTQIENTPLTELAEAWDFGETPSAHCSYSYHMPYGKYPIGTSSDPALAVAADRNPFLESSVATAVVLAGSGATVGADVDSVADGIAGLIPGPVSNRGAVGIQSVGHEAQSVVGPQ